MKGVGTRRGIFNGTLLTPASRASDGTRVGAREGDLEGSIMRTEHHTGPAFRRGRAIVVLALASFMGGCGTTARDLVGLPFDMAAHVAVETARLPYETAKLGAQGLVDVIVGAMQ
jgi:hypothetical protein